MGPGTKINSFGIKKNTNKRFFARLTAGILILNYLGFGQTRIDQSKLRHAEDLIRSGQLEQARQIYEHLYQMSPESADLYRRLKDLLFQMQDYDDAYQLIQNRKQTHPHHFQLDVSMGRALFRMQRQQEAMDLWYHLIEKNPQNLSVYQSIARVMINERLLEEAIDVYLLYRKKTGKTYLFTFNLVSLYLSRMNFDKATDELIQYLIQNPRQVSIVDNYLVRYPKTRRVMDGVTEKLRKAIKDNPEHAGLRELLIKTYVRSENFDHAFRESGHLASRSKNPGQILFHLGREAFLAGGPEEAERAYRDILKKYPKYSHLDQTLSGLAQALEAQSKYAEAVDFYLQTADRTSDPGLAAESLFQCGLIQRDHLFAVEESIRTFQTLQSMYPLNIQAKLAKFESAQSYIMAGDLKEAEKIYLQNLGSASLKKDRFWIQSLVGYAEVLFLQMKFDEMQNVLEKLTYDSLPEPVLNNPVLNNGLERQLLVKTHARRSLPQLECFAKAEFLIKKRAYQSAIQTLDSLIEMGSSHPLSANGLYKKGTVQLLLKQYDSSISTLDTLLARFPSSLLADRALEKTGWVLEKTGKEKEALERYETLLAEYPQSFLAEDIRKRIRILEDQ